MKETNEILQISGCGHYRTDPATVFQRDQRSGESLQQYFLFLFKLVDRMMKKGKGVIGDKELMLKEHLIDGVLDKQLQREMGRFAVDHPNASFQAFRQSF